MIEPCLTIPPCVRTEGAGEDDSSPGAGETGGRRQIDAGKESAMEAEVKAAKERAIIPLDIRMKQFRDMLVEKEVRNTDTAPTHLRTPCRNC